MDKIKHIEYKLMWHFSFSAAPQGARLQGHSGTGTAGKRILCQKCDASPPK